MNGTAYTAPGHGASVAELSAALVVAFWREPDLERSERIAAAHYTIKGEDPRAATNLVLLGRALTDEDLRRVLEVYVTRRASA